MNDVKLAVGKSGLGLLAVVAIGGFVLWQILRKRQNGNGNGNGTGGLRIGGNIQGVHVSSKGVELSSHKKNVILGTTPLRIAITWQPQATRGGEPTTWRYKLVASVTKDTGSTYTLVEGPVGTLTGTNLREDAVDISSLSQLGYAGLLGARDVNVILLAEKNPDNPNEGGDIGDGSKWPFQPGSVWRKLDEAKHEGAVNLIAGTLSIAGDIQAVNVLQQHILGKYLRR